MTDLGSLILMRSPWAEVVDLVSSGTNEELSIEKGSPSAFCLGERLEDPSAERARYAAKEQEIVGTTNFALVEMVLKPNVSPATSCTGSLTRLVLKIPMNPVLGLACPRRQSSDRHQIITT